MAKSSRKGKLNLTLTGGSLFAVVVLFLAMFHSASSLWVFLNLVGLLIVAGGILGAGMMMYPAREIKDCYQTVLALFFEQESRKVVAIFDLVKLAELQMQDAFALKRKVDSLDNALIRYGIELVSMGTKADDVKRQLELRSEMAQERLISHAGYLLSLAKLGPGFGLLGTLVGLVVLLQDMGSGGNFDKVGPALAISLLATLYGVIAANMLFQPLAEAIRYVAEQMRKEDSIVIDGVLMIREKKHPIQIREALKAHLALYEVVEVDQYFTLQASAEKKGSAAMGSRSAGAGKEAA
jgi:chemotaxis protein MotA